jgi:hypothetical protein
VDIFKKIKKLGLPIGKYVVIGGASLAARGIRDANDIDLLVLPGEFEKLRGKGFKERLYSDGNVTLVGHDFEISNKYMVNYKRPAGEAVKMAETINGVPFNSLKEEIRFKTAMGRKKDLRDIKLIREYLSKD